MAAAKTYVGRVGGLATALGIGVALISGTAVAGADSGRGSSSQASDTQSSSSVSAPQRGAVAGPAAKPVRSGNAARSAAAVSTLPRAAAVAAAIPAPDPKATVATPYGQLGKWMINKKGQVADWVGIPGGGNPALGTKTIQEPINTIFVVKADNAKAAQKTLGKALKSSGFGASNFSSIGYSGIVKTETYKQYPRGGIFGNNTGLFGLLFGVGPAYRDAPYNQTNTHLRTFGGAADGNGNFIFTGSVSTEAYVTIDGKKPHGYESFDGARTALFDAMVKNGATNLGLVDMANQIPADDPTYTTGDADGKARVIGIGIAPPV